MKFYLMKKSGVILFALTIGLFLSSCSKKNDSTANPNQGKTAKFTITVTGVNSKDVSIIGVTSAALNNSKSLWKINGVVQNDQTAVALSSLNFIGNTQTYIIESNTPLTGPIAVSVSCEYLNHNFTVSFKSEINGVVKENDQNVTVTSTSNYGHDFSY